MEAADVEMGGKNIFPYLLRIQWSQNFFFNILIFMEVYGPGKVKERC